MLTRRLRRHIELSFPPGQAEAVVEQLNSWSIPYERENPSERLLAAVVLLADGDPKRLAVGIRIADHDWRDLLIAAELAHTDWEQQLEQRLALRERA